MTAPRIPWPGRVPLRHVKQLQTGSPTAGFDCGPAADLMALQGASGAGIRPQRVDQKDWIIELRKDMKRGPTWPATTLDGQRASFLGRLMVGAFLGLRKGLWRPVTGVFTMPHSQVIKLLSEGRCLVVAVNYGTVNDKLPRLSGSTTFRGGHAIMLQGLARQRGVAWTRLGDPLHDGRRAGIPKGFQRVRVRRYLQAAETWGGVGKGRAAVLWVSKAEDR